MNYDSQRALNLLRVGTGLGDSQFRDEQEHAIRHIVEGRGRLLVVQRTGWGKSFVYFIATKLLREQGSGPALLISPLLALMRNQIAAAERMGLRAVTINSDNHEGWATIEAEVRQNKVDILLISPERLANERFIADVLGHVAARISLLVVDEAHCISDWGHDFRPHYRLIERIIRQLPVNMRMLATTATANHRVMADLEEVLGPSLEVSRGNLNRSSLRLQTIRMPGQAERLAWLAEQLPLLPGSGIIYALTVRDAVQIADWLKSRNLNVEAYTGETGERRPELEDALLANRVKALAATTALGMGFDKPDLAFVIHFQTPGSVVAYYQQVGRAGRAIASARGVLLSGEEESDINNYFLESAFPTREDVQVVLSALGVEGDGLSVPELLGRIYLSKGRIEKALVLLSLESPSPVVKQGAKWQLTSSELCESFWERAARLTELRRAEQAQMQRYVDLTSGHMEFLIKALDGESDVVGSIDSLPLATKIDMKIVEEAISFLRRSDIQIELRRQWPSGGLPQFGLKSSRIDIALQARPGRALCVWGDAGWGGLVKRGKYKDGRFDDQLVVASANLMDKWGPHPRPTWVTCIPSLRHRNLVPDFAKRLALTLRLPFMEVLQRTEGRPEQKTMENSVQQARNVDGALAICSTAVPGGPVLLVDDMVDSRWTLTIGAWLLRKHGSGEVFPYALAVSGHES